MVHTQGGVWPRQESCNLRGVQGLALVLSEVSRLSSEASGSNGRFGGPHTTRCIHKVVHTQGGANTRRFVATAGVLLFKGGAGVGPCVERSELKQWEVWRSTYKAMHTQGGAHTMRSVATAGVL